MKSDIKILILCVFLSISSLGFSQIIQKDRLEFAIEEGSVDFDCFSFKNDGFVVLFRKDQNMRFPQEHTFIHHDTTLKEVGRNTIIVPKRYRRQKHYKTNNALFVMFYSVNEDRYILSKFDLSNHAVSKWEGQLDKYIHSGVESFYIVGDTAFISGFGKKRKGFHRLIDLQTGNEISNRYESTGKFKVIMLNERVLEKPREFYSLFTNRKTNIHKARFYNQQLQRDTSIKFDRFENGHQLLKKFIVPTRTPNGTYITGLYSDKKGFTNHYGAGIFVSLHNESGREFIKFYPLSNLDQFYNFLREKKQTKQEEKAETAKEDDKTLEDWATKSRIFMHQLFEHNGELILIGEVHVETERPVYKEVNGVKKTEWKFDGYQYTHAIVVAFDKEGNILWNNVMNMHMDNKPFDLEPVIRKKASPNGDLMIAYVSGKYLNYAVFNKSNTLKKKYKVSLKTKDKTEEGLYTWKAKLDYLTDSSFLSWGQRQIGKKKKVFFVNKLTLNGVKTE